MGHETFESLVLLAYDAPLHADGWTPFLDALRSTTRSRGASLKWNSLVDGRARFASAGIEDDVMRRYATAYGALDPWGKVPVTPGDDVFGDEMLSRSRVEASEYYCDFGRPNHIQDIHKVVLARSADNVQVSLGILKAERTDVSEDERDLTRRLAPHLQRALALTAWVGDLQHERSALAEALDAGSRASLLLDGHGQVRFASGAAEHITRAGDGLAIVKRHLKAVHDDDDRALYAHLANAHVHGDVRSGPVLVRRTSGRTPYRVLAQPLPERHGHAAHTGATTLVLVDDPASRLAHGMRGELLLRQRHGLTPTEARVALRIALGESPREVAVALGTSWNTVRAHLRAVFAKTGTRRQSALVSLVTRLDR